MHGPHPLTADSGIREMPEPATSSSQLETIDAGVARRPRHIVHVITRLLQGGAEENTVSTCLYQVRQGARVTLVHGPGPHPSWEPRLRGQVRLIEVPTLGQSLNPVRDAKAIGDLRKLLMSLRPDVVHTHQSKAGILGRLAAALARVPLIAHTVHIAPFVNVRGPRRWFYVTAERICQRYTHLFISVSHGMREAFFGEGIGRNKEFDVIHSGMPLAKFKVASPPQDWRSRIGGWDAPERPKFILMLAAFEPRKRHCEFLKAIAPALHARPGICLLLAGEGSEQERCRELARSLDIDQQVRFLGHDPKPEELIALSDVCVLTSEREGLPRSAVQYVAGGKPVVLSRLPGIEELIVDGVNGIITDPDDLRETVARILGLIEDEIHLARLASGARETDVSRWREDAMGERIEASYRRVQSSIARNRDRLAGAPICAIEFFGLPGSGKTRLARNVVTLLQEEGRRVGFSGDIMGDQAGLWRRSARRMALMIKVLPWHARKALRSGRHFSIGRSSPKDMLKSLWNYFSVLAMSLRHERNGQGMLVLDQGLTQAIWSARMHGSVEGGQADGGMLATSGGFNRSLFVHVQTSTDTARARLERRKAKTSRMQRADRIGRLSLWERGDEIASDLAVSIESELEQRSLPSRLMRVWTSEETDPKELAKVVVARLKAVEASD